MIFLSTVMDEETNTNNSVEHYTVLMMIIMASP